MVAAAAPGVVPRSGRCSGGRQNTPDPAGSGSHSRFPARPPAADTRLESETTPHPRIRGRPQVADQVEINCGRSAVQHKEDTFRPTSTHADILDKAACDGI